MSRLTYTLVALLSAPALAFAIVRPDQFYVERVEFVGQAHASEAELRHLADLRNGTSWWTADLAAVTVGVARHPWVSSVVVERRLPDAVVVTVTEHEPVALLAFGRGLYYVNADGRPFLPASTSDLDYPVIVGITPDLEKASGDLPRQALRDAVTLLAKLDGAGRTGPVLPASEISELRFEPTRGWTLQVTGGTAQQPTAEILFAFDDYEGQVDRLAALIAKDVDLTRPLHVDLAPRDVAIVRPLDAPPPLTVPVVVDALAAANDASVAADAPADPAAAPPSVPAAAPAASPAPAVPPPAPAH